MDDTMKVKDQCHTTITNDKVNEESSLQQLHNSSSSCSNATATGDDGDDDDCESIKECKQDVLLYNDSSSVPDSLVDSTGKLVYHINMLPDEMLEFILTYLPPYKDLENCSLVCKRWQEIVKSKWI